MRCGCPADINVEIAWFDDERPVGFVEAQVLCPQFEDQFFPLTRVQADFVERFQFANRARNAGDAIVDIDLNDLFSRWTLNILNRDLNFNTPFSVRDG